jgi:large subunit ribosomal protein L18
MYKRVNPRAERKLRHKRVRRRVSGTPLRPRLAVYRSLSHVYAQVIDDVGQNTLAHASTLDPEVRPQLDGKTKSERAAIVGRVVAERAKAAGIDAVVFDRGGFIYHGRVKALAEGAREAGLVF